MAKGSRWLEIRRKQHGLLWWLIIGWWERPIAGILWTFLASVVGFKGIKYHYYK